MSEPRRYTRMARAVMLAAFLMTQPWAICPGLCLVQGHGIALAATHHHMPAGACHGDRLTQHQLPTGLQVGVMLPSSWLPTIPTGRTIAQQFAPPARLHLDHPALPEPPPPRLA